MKNYGKGINDAASEVTAIISIFREKEADSVKAPGKPQSEFYSMHLSFVGSVLLPPYLPRFWEHTTRIKKNDISNGLNRLAESFETIFGSDHSISLQEVETYNESLILMGSSIADYLDDFIPALKIFPDLNVKNVIIHTDEYSIPWTWAFYDNSIIKDFDFLCGQYSCGTILVDDTEGALSRLKMYTAYNRQPDIKWLSRREVCLFAGHLGVTAKDSKIDLGEIYVQKLSEFFESAPISWMNIRRFGPDDWKEFTISPQRMIGFLNEAFRNAQVIHFTCHVVEGKMCFDNEMFISPNDLRENLNYLNSKPLVILHGCSSGRLYDFKSAVAQLSKVFLEKGASGCLTSILPVNLPRGIAGTVTMIELFYKNVLAFKPYGQALLDARKTYRREYKNDPQWLFYQLYGDPRARLIAPISTTKNLIEQLDQQEEEKTVIIQVEGILLEETQLLNALSKVNGISHIKKLSTEKATQTVTLGLGETLGVPTFQIVFTCVIGATANYLVPLVFEKIEELLRKKNKNIVLKETSKERPAPKTKKEKRVSVKIGNFFEYRKVVKRN